MKSKLEASHETDYKKKVEFLFYGEESSTGQAESEMDKAVERGFLAPEEYEVMLQIDL